MPTNAKSTTAQRAQVKRLAGEGVSLRQIAVLVFGDARYKGRAERILKQHTRSSGRRSPRTTPSSRESTSTR